MLNRLAAAVGGGLITVLLAGCVGPAPGLPTVSPQASATVSPSSPTATATVSPTPAPSLTWSADQAAAVAAVAQLLKVSEEVRADPSKFTKAQVTARLAPYSGGNMLTAGVTAVVKMQKEQVRRLGSIVVVSTIASAAVDNRDERGRQVHVTVCQDQRNLSYVDRDGDVATSWQKETPAFNLRQYSVRKPAGSSGWRVYGAATVAGRCGA